jgi:hypothetical protein
MQHTGDDLRNQCGPKVIGSLWLLHDRMHSWLFVRILPTAVVKMVNKSQINETYSLMKFSTLSAQFEFAP